MMVRYAEAGSVEGICESLVAETMQWLETSVLLGVSPILGT